MASKPSDCNSLAEKTVISGNIGSIETYYQLKAADTKVVLQWCMDKGLIASRYHCPKCRKPMVLTPRSDTYFWVCRVYGQNAHHVKRSVRVGSWFERSNLSLPKILLFLIFWCLEMKPKFILEQLNIAPQTAADWASFCREICLNILISQSGRIGGPGCIVEIYESKFDKRAFHQGKSVAREWIFCGLERGTNNSFFVVVENRNSEFLLSVIEEYILAGTTIISDCWKSYNCHSRKGFRDLAVNHDVQLVDPDTKTHSTFMKAMWGEIKKNLHGTKHVQGQFDSYLAEYMWRRQYSSSDSRMRSLFEMIKQIYPPFTEDAFSPFRDENRNQPKCPTNAKEDVQLSLKKNMKRSECSTNAKEDAQSPSKKINVKRSKCSMDAKQNVPSLSEEESTVTSLSSEEDGAVSPLSREEN